MPPNYSKPIARSTSQYTWTHHSSDSSNICSSNNTNQKDNEMSTNGTILAKNNIKSSCYKSNDIDALLCDNPQIRNNDKQPKQIMVSSDITTKTTTTKNFNQIPINSLEQQENSLTTNNVILPSKSSLCLDLDLAMDNTVNNDTTKINGIKCLPPLTCPNGFDGNYLPQLPNSSLMLK